uniref:Uncharacterized protein n=1 Tax=Hucho hucho TaxID=62062 RepID=A0A4W5MKI5_9TELE
MKYGKNICFFIPVVYCLIYHYSFQWLTLCAKHNLHYTQCSVCRNAGDLHFIKYLASKEMNGSFTNRYKLNDFTDCCYTDGYLGCDEWKSVSYLGWALTVNE